MKKYLETVYVNGHYYLYRALEEIGGGGYDWSDVVSTWSNVVTTSGSVCYPTTSSSTSSTAAQPSTPEKIEEKYLMPNGIEITKSEIIEILRKGFNKMTREELVDELMVIRI